MNTPTTRTLIFDLSETLVGGLFWMAGPLAQKLGEAEDTVVRSLGGDPLVALVEGRSTEQEYWGAILNLTGWAATQVELASMARDAFRRTVPGMPDLLGELEGYRRVLLSDHAEEWMADIDRQQGAVTPSGCTRFHEPDAGPARARTPVASAGGDDRPGLAILGHLCPPTAIGL